MTEAVRILRVASGGDGVGHLPDGRVLFVPRTAPGDLIEPTELRMQPRFARGLVGRLIEPGPSRVEPRCRHYVVDACGGCQLQHLSSEAQRDARRSIVGDSVRRIGRLDLADPTLESGATEWNYRSKITLAVDPVGPRAGFHRFDQPGEIFQLQRCEIADERVNQTWLRLRGAHSDWPPAVSHIVVRVGHDGSVHAIFRGPVRPDESLSRAAEAEIWWQPPDADPRPLTGNLDAAAVIPPGVFEQVHPVMGSRVRAFAVEQLGPIANRHLWDLYAGIGETTALLAEAGATVESVELDRQAVAVAQCAGHSASVTRRAGRAEEWVERLRPPYAVITNPPRTGMDQRVIRALLGSGSAVLVYVSCDPATLARDLARLSSEYQVGAMRSFDLFPQTAHVETVVRLERS